MFFFQSVDVFLQAVNGQISISKVRLWEIEIYFYHLLRSDQHYQPLGLDSPNSGMLSKIRTRLRSFHEKIRSFILKCPTIFREIKNFT